jgi:hypothetical protein
VEISCQLPVHLFDKSDTFDERKEKAVQSRDSLTTNNWFSGRFFALTYRKSAGTALNNFQLAAPWILPDSTSED